MFLRKNLKVGLSPRSIFVKDGRSKRSSDEAERPGQSARVPPRIVSIARGGVRWDRSTQRPLSPVVSAFPVADEEARSEADHTFSSKEGAMKVVILCGGQGTRLRAETEFRPKPMVEVGQKPILWHIMKLYSHYGFRDFVLCLGYRGNFIKEYFLKYEAMNSDFTISLGSRQRIHFHQKHHEQDYQVTLADTGQETMTGGRVRRVHPHIDGDTFLVT